MLQPAFASNTTGAPEPRSVHSKVASPTSMVRCCCKLTSAFVCFRNAPTRIALVVTRAIAQRSCPGRLREGDHRPEFPAIRCNGRRPLSLAKTGLHRRKALGLGVRMSSIVSMSLDFAECDRARLARDSVYDGRFYTGVHTTGIYCRPVCPVRPARSANVSFFPSAAAAEAAGFRPCLRCRPETAPFCSAWIGSRATVERALRLIVEDGALDAEGATVERLAVRLGVGARQLTRLFTRHLQASPAKVARTARVQRAKRFIDETSLPMTEIAMQAGFGSLRRFNSVFAEVYGRPPTEIRRTRRPATKEVKTIETAGNLESLTS
jgi:AraC family transcriptional regulator, regulatory protein of adaptative response / methylated-DNA-[protein]-cysteine methyltransferase